MTERRSWSALAREIYGHAVAGDPRLGPRASAAKKTPLPNPPPQGGREQIVQRGREEAPTPDPSPRFANARGGGEKKETALTARARKMYEETSMTVREIARLCGVTERTIYKYAARQNWQPRYAWNPLGTRPRGASWQAGGALAPVKGAGGRFVPRDDCDKPVATGLKAVDAAAARRADRDLAAASAVEHDAWLDAISIRQMEERNRAWTRINKALAALERHRARKAQEAVDYAFPRQPYPAMSREDLLRKNLATRAKLGVAYDPTERPLWDDINAATQYLDSLQKLHDNFLAEAQAQRPSGTS